MQSENNTATGPTRADRHIHPLPRRIEDVDAEWLTQALADRYPGTVVTACDIGRVIPGSATKLRLMLEYNELGHSHRLPPTMWLKGGFVRHEHTYDESFVQEAKFFADWAPKLPINIPTSHFEAVEPGVQGLVLLEDLNARNVTFGYSTRPISTDQQAAVLDILATLHARWWESPELCGLESFSTSWRAAEDVVMRMLERNYFERCLASPRGREIRGRYRDPEIVADALRSQWDHARQVAQCFVHGDAHLGNMFFERDGKPGFLDWQKYQSGPYMHDVAYSVIGNLEVEDRRACERDLIRHYLSGLAANGLTNPPSFDDAWNAYRRHAIHGFTWFLCPVEMQPEEVCQTEGWRFGVAVSDLDTFGALGV